MLKGAFRAIETQVVTWFSEFRSGVISVEAWTIGKSNDEKNGRKCGSSDGNCPLKLKNHYPWTCYHDGNFIWASSEHSDGQIEGVGLPPNSCPACSVESRRNVSARARTLTKRHERNPEFLSTIITGSETQKTSKSTVSGKDILSVSKMGEIRSCTCEEYVHCLFSRHSHGILHYSFVPQGQTVKLTWLDIETLRNL
jgi:hypothetical protein